METIFKFERMTARKIEGKEFVLVKYKNESGVFCDFLSPAENLKFLPMSYQCTLRNVPLESTIEITNISHDKI